MWFWAGSRVFGDLSASEHPGAEETAVPSFDQLRCFLNPGFR